MSSYFDSFRNYKPQKRNNEEIIKKNDAIRLEKRVSKFKNKDC